MVRAMVRAPRARARAPCGRGRPVVQPQLQYEAVVIERAVMIVCYGACVARQQPSPPTIEHSPPPIVHAEATGPPRRERRARLFIKQHVAHVALGGAVVGAVAPPARPQRDFLRRPLLLVCLRPQTSRMGFLSAAAIQPHVFIWVQPLETNIICKFKWMQIQVEISC